MIRVHDFEAYICQDCYGSGAENFTICSACKGHGQVSISECKNCTAQQQRPDPMWLVHGIICCSFCAAALEEYDGDSRTEVGRMSEDGRA